MATPPSHILGLLNLLAAASAGATVRLHRRFDLDEVLRRIESERMTLEMAVAPIALAMANHPHLEDYDLSSLRYIMWGATPVSESVAPVGHRAHRRALAAGLRRQRGAGDRRQPGRPTRAAWRLDSAGLPPAGRRAAGGRPRHRRGARRPAGSARSRCAARRSWPGYLPDEATADAFADGWYRTGDVGWLEPEGWVHLTDRSKEMIKVNGFQVAPAEIEAVLHGHPAVLDCAVFGIPDERAGEVPVAAVQLDPERPVTEEELQQLVADSLATYKQLRHVVVVDAIPRLPSGKVLRRTLRDEWTPALAATPGERLMDVRLSPRAAGAARLGRPGRRPARAPGRRPARRPRAGGEAGRRGRRRRAGASCGPPSDGGAPLASGVEAAIVAEELGRGLADAPFLGPTLAAELRRLAGAPAGHCGRDRRPRARARRRWPSTVDGRSPEAPWPSTPTGARRRSCWSRGPDGHRLALVGRCLPVAERTDLDPALGRRPPAAGRPGCRSAAPGRSPTTTSRGWTALGLALTCADLVGTMRGAVRPGRASTPRPRRQYGAAHRLVPGRPAPAGRRLRGHGGLAQRRPARGLGRRRPAARRRRGRRRGGQGLLRPGGPRRCARPPIQVHGGIGNTWECLAHVYLRRALLSSDLLGGAGPNLERVLDHHGIGGRDGLR